MPALACSLRLALLVACVLGAGALLWPSRSAVAVEVGTGGCSMPIPDLFEKASPAVVMITGKSVNPYRLRDRISRVLGSGFIIDKDGLILTNSHVVFGLQSLTVTLDDGSMVPGKLVGADPIFDIAAIQIPKPKSGTLPTVRLGDSDSLRPGEDVIAIGNPLGLDQTVTRGIVSAVNRILPETPLSLTEPLIQTDAPINPGSSGGPLLNRCGEVVGINSAIVPDAQNIGFSIPINLAKSILPSLLKDGRLIRPWIGFHGQLIGADVQKLLQMPLVEGLLVEVVEPGSPAEKAGIRGGEIELMIGGASLLLGGDIVVSINGAMMTQPEKLAGIMRSLKVGSVLRLKLFRQGKSIDVQYTLPERPLLPGDLPDAGTYAPVPPPATRGNVGGHARPLPKP
jgi:S1-C subfamily serine protease